MLKLNILFNKFCSRLNFLVNKAIKANTVDIICIYPPVIDKTWDILVNVLLWKFIVSSNLIWAENISFPA